MAEQPKLVAHGFVDPPTEWDPIGDWKDWEAEVSDWPADPQRTAYLKEAREMIRQKRASGTK